MATRLRIGYPPCPGQLFTVKKMTVKETGGVSALCVASGESFIIRGQMIVTFVSMIPKGSIWSTVKQSHPMFTDQSRDLFVILVEGKLYYIGRDRFEWYFEGHNLHAA